MSAIITDPFKKQFMQNILNEVTSLSARYYIGIGKNDQWNVSETVPTPTDTPKNIRLAQAGLQSVKAVAAASYIIPRYNWSSGQIYNGYDDQFTEIPSNSYYVLTEDNQVYICLQQSKNATGAANASTVKPSGTTTKPFKTSDGYTWKFLYGLSASRTSAFLSANFVPVEKVDSADDTFETQQKSVQDSAIAGRILNVIVTNGGTGYDSSGEAVVTISGNAGVVGDSAQATATVASGSVVKIDMLNESAGSGKNFENATVTIAAPSSGTTALARAVIGPANGIGADPRDDLKATSLMFNSKPSGAEGGDFLIGGDPTDFRQVMLIRNPLDSASGNTLTAGTGKALKFLKVDSAFAGGLSIDELITNGLTPPAKAFVNEVVNEDTSGAKVYYHQTDSTGFTAFNVGNTVTDEQGNTGTLVRPNANTGDSASSFDDLLNNSGEILYIENRSPTIRTDQQTEDIKIVVTL